MEQISFSSQGNGEVTVDGGILCGIGCGGYLCFGLECDGHACEPNFGTGCNFGNWCVPVV